MFEIKFEERKKVNELYERIKNIILSKKDQPEYHYERQQHHLYEESEYPGISKNYYNEEGSITFTNYQDEKVKLEISRWHPHKHNGCSGLNGIPNLKATISLVGDEEQLIWKLKVESGTMYYKSLVSSLDLPSDILKEKEPVSEQNESMEEPKDSTPVETQPSNSKSILSEIEELYNSYTLAIKSKEDLKGEHQKEIDEAIARVNQLYSSKIEESDKEIDQAKKRIKDLEKSLSKFCTFDINQIGLAFQTLISFMENEDYVYHKAAHNFKKRVHGVMDSWDEDDKTRVIIIVRKDKLMNSYDSDNKSESKIKALVERGYAILLSEQSLYAPDKSQISFYTFQNGQPISNIDFGKFSYVKEFIDGIIKHRIQNNMLDFSGDDLLLFLKSFITNHIDIIISNYDSKIKERILKLQLS